MDLKESVFIKVLISIKSNIENDARHVLKSVAFKLLICTQPSIDNK